MFPKKELPTGTHSTPPQIKGSVWLINYGNDGCIHMQVLMHLQSLMVAVTYDFSSFAFIITHNRLP